MIQPKFSKPFQILRHFILTSLIVLSGLAAFIKEAQAADIRMEMSDLGKLLFPTLVVHLNGEIVEGDAKRVREILAANVIDKQRGIYFVFDSPGGLLLEGVRIGRVIADQFVHTTSLVGTPDDPNAICASACVFAFLGAGTREKGPNGRIGLHQFSIPNNNFSGAKALGYGQQLSAILTTYLSQRGASLEIFDRMVLTPPSEIDWVSDTALVDLGILGGNIIHQSSEFVNNSGSSALKMSLMSRSGEQTLLLGCNNPGVYVVASILALDDEVSFSDAALILDDERVQPAHIEVIGIESRRVVLLFVMSPELASAATQSAQIGSYYFDDIAEHWVGSMLDIDHSKFEDIVSSCIN